MFRRIFSAAARLADSLNLFASTVEEANQVARVGMGLDSHDLDEFIEGEVITNKALPASNGRRRRATAKSRG